jgi:hypothetical protein
MTPANDSRTRIEAANECQQREVQMKPCHSWIKIGKLLWNMESILTHCALQALHTARAFSKFTPPC